MPKAPFSYEWIHESYRVRDANDDRIATCWAKENAEFVVAQLNAAAGVSPPVTPCADPVAEMHGAVLGGEG